jgi:hypothetical protein
LFVWGVDAGPRPTPPLQRHHEKGSDVEGFGPGHSGLSKVGWVGTVCRNSYGTIVDRRDVG